MSDWLAATTSSAQEEVVHAAALGWSAHPEAWLLCGGLLLAYFWSLRRHGPLFHPRRGEAAATTGQKVAFVSGVLMLWVSSASPLHDAGEDFLFSAHMVQHLIDAFVVPPLLLLGTPTWMAELVLRHPRLRAAVRHAGRPLVAGLAFNAVLLAIHWPLLVDLMVRSEVAHLAVHVPLLVAATLMWLSVVSPAPDVVPRLPLPAQMGYLFLMTLLPTIPSSFLTFGETPLYPAYVDLPRLWGIGALDDMRVAGLIMKIGGGFYLWGIIAVLFFRWARQEEALTGAADDPGAMPSTPRPPHASTELPG